VILKLPVGHAKLVKIKEQFMNEISVSIIIPTYNRENFVTRAVNSVLSITDSNIELLVIDNASDDNTVNRLKIFENDKRFRIIVNKENCERSYSRNKGMKEAKGSFLTFLDSDDTIDPLIFNKFREFYKNNKQYNIFYTNYRFVDRANNEIKKNRIEMPYCNQDILANGNHLSNIGVFFSKVVYKNISFDENKEIIGIEDYDFNLRTLNKFGTAIRFSKKPLANICEHLDRSINLDSVKVAEKRFIYFKNKILNDPSYKSFSTKIKKRIISTSCIYLSLICVRNEKKYKCIKYLYISILNSSLIFLDRRFVSIFYKLIFS